MKIWFILLVNIITLLAYWHYQPQCEPCLPNTECSPCRSPEQYLIGYSFMGFNILALLSTAVKKLSKVQKNNLT